jgi:Mg2+-importing ATPase
VVSYVTEDMKATIVIASMVLLSTLLRFVQEGRSNRAAARLKAMVSSTATVLRRNGGPHASRRRGPTPSTAASASRRVARGAAARAGARRHRGAVGRRHDPGRLPPAVRQGPVREPGRHDRRIAAGGKARRRGRLEWRRRAGAGNLLFMGTNVVSGSAMAVVLATGNRTYFGTWPRGSRQDRAPTAFEAGVNSVSWLLIRFAAVMVPVVLHQRLHQGRLGRGLPVRAVGGRGPDARDAAHDRHLHPGQGRRGAVAPKVIVKRLDAIQNFGAMDVLCTDKTGTLTQDRIVLERHTDARASPATRCCASPTSTATTRPA